MNFNGGVDSSLPAHTPSCVVFEIVLSEEEEEDGDTAAKATVMMNHAQLEEEKKSLLQNKELLDEVRHFY